MTMVNTSLLVLSLKYINNKYEIISNISKWIYEELVKSQYDEFKLRSMLYKVHKLKEIDLEIIDLLIKFDHDRKVVNEFLSIYVKPYMYHEKDGDFLKMLKIFIDNNVDIHINDEIILRQASYFGLYNTVKLMIDNGADIRTKDDEALRLASNGSHFKVCDLLIENGANEQKFDIRTILNYYMYKST